MKPTEKWPIVIILCVLLDKVHLQLQWWEKLIVAVALFVVISPVARLVELLFAQRRIEKSRQGPPPTFSERVRRAIADTREYFGGPS